MPDEQEREQERDADAMREASDNPILFEDAMKLLKGDLLKAAQTLSPREARFIVDFFYQLQDDRKRAGNQQLAAVEAEGGVEPNQILRWMTGASGAYERKVQAALAAYSQGQEVGRWAQSQVGIGPIISAGLLAHIDVRRAKTAGAVWRFAGLDVGNPWIGAEEARGIVRGVLGETDRGKLGHEQISALALSVGRGPESMYRAHAFLKKIDEDEVSDDGRYEMTRTEAANALAVRPWNAKLKVLCWKIGESFNKTQNRDDDFYGHLLAERKALEVQRNEAGDFLDQAVDKLEKYNIGKSTEAYKWYDKGMLPPAHLQARAKRWVVKLFISHWHEVQYQVVMGTLPPKPYAIDILGHGHKIEAPGWPMAA